MLPAEGLEGLRIAMIEGLANAKMNTAYGWALEDTTSFVKLLADPTTRRLLGAHIIGPHAAPLIQPLVQGISLDNTIDQLAHDVLYIHPPSPRSSPRPCRSFPAHPDSKRPGGRPGQEYLDLHEGTCPVVASNKQQRKASTLLSTATYWLVLAVLGAATVGSMVVVVDAGATIVGAAGLIGGLAFASLAISYGLSMRNRKQAPSR